MSAGLSGSFPVALHFLKTLWNEHKSKVWDLKFGAAVNEPNE